MDKKIAALLMSVGSPENPDDMEAYLLNFRHGRPVSPEFVDEIKSRYREVGGSPLLKVTQKQADALQKVLDPAFKVYVGMRYWHPFVEDVVKTISNEGYRTLVSFPTTPYYSGMSVKLYHEQIKAALEKRGLSMDLIEINHWNINSHFLKCWENLIRTRLGEMSNPHILFTAHSLPERILKTNDPYPSQFLETVQRLVQSLELKNWTFAYQSQGGSREPWLSPTVEEKLKAFSKSAQKEVLIVPVGFVADHVEILYDIDIHFKKIASELELRLERTEMPNDHPEYIAALQSVLLKEVRGRVTHEEGPDFMSSWTHNEVSLQTEARLRSASEQVVSARRARYK